MRQSDGDAAAVGVVMTALVLGRANKAVCSPLAVVDAVTSAAASRMLLLNSASVTALSTGTIGGSVASVTRQKNVAPPISLGESTAACPPISSLRPRTIESPSPVPPNRRVVEESACSKKPTHATAYFIAQWYESSRCNYQYLPA